MSLNGDNEEALALREPLNPPSDEKEHVIEVKNAEDPENAQKSIRRVFKGHNKVEYHVEESLEDSNEHHPRYHMSCLGFLIAPLQFLGYIILVILMWALYLPALIILALCYLVHQCYHLICRKDIGGAPIPEKKKTSCTFCTVSGYTCFTGLKNAIFFPSIRAFLRIFEKKRDADLHTKILWMPLKGAIANFRAYAAAEIPVSGADPECVQTVKVANDNFYVAKTDEDVSIRSETEDWAIGLIHKCAPHIDSRELWNSAVEGEKEIREKFLHGKFKPMQNAFWGSLEDIQSDACMTKMAFQGLGATCVVHRSKFSEVALENATDDEIYCVDLDFLWQYVTRDDYERYAGIVYYDKNRRITRILYRNRNNELKVYMRGDKEWTHAKFAVRTVMFAWLTFNNHLLYTHFTMANSVQLSQRRNLGLHSPLKKFIKPFTFRTAAINKQAAGSLFAKGCTLQRALPQTWEEFTRMIDDIVGTCVTARTFPQSLAERGFDADFLDDKDDDFFPYMQDGMDLWNTMHDFVTAYMKKSYPNENASEDPDIQAFWDDLKNEILDNVFVKEDLKEGPEGQAQLVDFMTTFLFTVSGYHEHVGNIGEYVLNPAMVASRFRFGDEIATIQSSYQLALVTALTGIRQPPLMGDLSIHFNSAREEYFDFKNKLSDLSNTIALRNAERKQQFFSFDPDKLEVSVSI